MARQCLIEGIRIRAEVEQPTPEIREAGSLIDHAIRFETKARIHREGVAVLRRVRASPSVVGEIGGQDRCL